MSSPSDPISPEQAQALVSAGRQVQLSSPWKLLGNEDIFAVEVGSPPETWAVGVMGAAGEAYGLNFYHGPAGIEFLVSLVEGVFENGDEQMEAWAELHGFTLEFVAADELEDGSEALLERAGLETRTGSEAFWPEFRILRPNRPPRELRSGEVDRFLLLLRAFQSAFAVIERDPEAIEWTVPPREDARDHALSDADAGMEDRGAVHASSVPSDDDSPACHSRPEGEAEDTPIVGFPVWSAAAESFVHRDFPATDFPVVPVEFSTHSRDLLRERMGRPADGEWDLGRVFIGVMDPERDPDTASYGEGLLIVDRRSGYVLAATPGRRDQRGESLSRLFAQVIEETERLPIALGCADASLQPTVSRFCDDHGVEFRRWTSPVLGEALEHLQRSLR